MKVKITKEVQDSINKLGNKTARKNGLKIYAALYMKLKLKNKDGYFPVPSTLLESINKRYNNCIRQLINDGLLDFYKTYDHIDPNDIFNTISRRYFKPGLCMKYKFMFDVDKGYEIDINMDNQKKLKWFDITKNSLQQLGYENIKISRDDFGRRVHHNLTQIYKDELKDKGYSVIDAKCSQPRLLYIKMKQSGIIDYKYNEIFETGQDFYLYLVTELKLDGNISGESPRKDAKDIFMYWLNSNGYVPNYKINYLFPEASKFLSRLKIKNYKDSSSFFQREEAKIWIDDLLENIKTSFALTIHDSLIVKDVDANSTLLYCKDKYPELEFQMTQL